MTVLQFLITFLVPALGGLLLGFPAGVIATLYWVGRRRERGEPVPIYTDDDNPTPGRTPWRGREHLSRLGWLLVVLGVVGFVAGMVALVQNNNTADCLAEFNARFTTAQRERSEAADLDRQAVNKNREVTRNTLGAMTTLLTTDVGGDRDAGLRLRDEFVAKLRAYDAELAEVDRLNAEAEQKRRANPLPPEPDC